MDRAKQRIRSQRWRDKNPDYAATYSKPWRDARKRERKAMIDALKLESGCVDCEYNANPLALEFDHVRGIKIKQVSDLWLANIDDLSAEILKCDVRCSNCHRIVTAQRRTDARN